MKSERIEFDVPFLLLACARIVGIPIGRGNLSFDNLATLQASSRSRNERKLRIVYSDERDNRTNRTIWPIALGFFDRVRMVAAWCESRSDYRHFRTDRIVSITLTERRYPRRRTDLLREWRQQECIGER